MSLRHGKRQRADEMQHVAKSPEPEHRRNLGSPALDETEVALPRIKGMVVIPAQARTQPLRTTHLRAGFPLARE